MPWCEDCSRFYNPTTLGTKGECPTCGRALAEAQPRAVPWHFKLMLVALVIYLSYRVVQGVVWLVHHV